MHLDMSVMLEKNFGMQPKKKHLTIAECRQTNISGNSLHKENTEQD